jgi:hypothetical protein
MAIFNLKELGAIHMVINGVIESADEMGVPLPILDSLHSILEKIEPLIEEECRIFNEFQSITESLDELELSAQILIKDPSVDLPEYH